MLPRVEVLMTFGNYDEAMATLETCMRKDDGSELYPSLSNDHWMMGLIWDLLGAHDRAKESATQAVKYAMIDEMKRAVVRSHALLAHEDLMLGDIRAAEAALETISLLAEREGISSKAVGTGLFWLVMAEMHLVKGAEDLSEMELRNALSIIDKNEPDLLFSAIARLWFGQTMARIGAIQRAKEFLGEAAQRFTGPSNLDQAQVHRIAYLGPVFPVPHRRPPLGAWPISGSHLGTRSRIGGWAGPKGRCRNSL